MMQELSTIDDLPASNVELEPEKIEDGKDGGPSFHCDLYDTELVHKIAQVFIPGLATACVDNTSGDIFKTPASVAADVRKEMVEYVTQRSENFVAESVILEGGQDGQVSDHPYDIISDFVDDFASSKRNLFSRVSGWLFSENREDKIDDFVQEMEINAFWLVDKREAIVQSFLKNVDLKNEYHCNMKFYSPEELAAHVSIVAIVGCQSPVPHGKLEQHRSDDLHSHLLFVLQSIHKEASTEDLNRRLEQLKEASSSNQLAQARDVRSLTSAVKDLEANLGPMEVSRKHPEDLEAKHGPEEDLEAKPVPKEVSKQSEYLEAKPVPKEVSRKPAEDLEAEPAPKEVSSKHSEDLEAKPVLKEVSNSKPLEDVEARPEGVSSKAPKQNLKQN
ncbi:hypothetical protein M0R45_036093 [Rubus argutus]|uniref:Uncharacterized protein n=1 Tax=Rubus argutus TaxID=59490 RepID=A0AAW1VYQ6_RUBAR